MFEKESWWLIHELVEAYENPNQWTARSVWLNFRISFSLTFEVFSRLHRSPALSIFT